MLPGPRTGTVYPRVFDSGRPRIESTDPDKTFKLGLIYGPSGCGKSSLVRAGLLPRLGKHVLPVYVEATGEETEVRVLKGIRKTCPQIPQGLGLARSMAHLRRGDDLPAGQKVLIVVDQFEQWLHTKHGERAPNWSTPFVSAMANVFKRL